MDATNRETFQTLFLDRDGVINQRLPGQYVTDWSEFEFLPGVLEALALLKEVFFPIVVVTNQQGIGKGIMEEEDLHRVHQQMQDVITAEGGRIDGVYYCPELSTQAGNCRKPAPTMAQWAKQDFPEINWAQSVMVGDSRSDLEFGRNLGMLTVYIETKHDEHLSDTDRDVLVDTAFGSLYDFANWWLT